MKSPDTITGGQIPPTEPNSIQEPEAITKLSEQVSQTQQALAQLVELQKQQMMAQQKPAEPVAPPEDFDAKDILNPNTPSGEYFAKVIQDREKRIVSTLEQEFTKKMEDRMMQLETERAMNERLQSLAQQKELDGDKLVDFKKWMSSPENVDIETLFEVYNKVSSKKPAAPVARMSNVAGAPGGGTATSGFLSGLK